MTEKAIALAEKTHFLFDDCRHGKPTGDYINTSKGIVIRIAGNHIQLYPIKSNSTEFLDFCAETGVVLHSSAEGGKRPRERENIPPYDTLRETIRRFSTTVRKARRLQDADLESATNTYLTDLLVKK